MTHGRDAVAGWRVEVFRGGTWQPCYDQPREGGVRWSVVRDLDDPEPRLMRGGAEIRPPWRIWNGDRTYWARGADAGERQ